jgi:hypothetical protein
MRCQSIKVQICPHLSGGKYGSLKSDCGAPSRMTRLASNPVVWRWRFPILRAHHAPSLSTWLMKCASSVPASPCFVASNVERSRVNQQPAIAGSSLHARAAGRHCCVHASSPPFMGPRELKDGAQLVVVRFEWIQREIVPRSIRWLRGIGVLLCATAGALWSSASNFTGAPRIRCIVRGRKS